MAKDILKLKDGTEIAIEEGASLGQIVHIAASETKAAKVCNALTKENVSHVEFWNDGAETAYGIYDNIMLVAQPTRQNQVDENEDPTGKVIVTISLREQTELEERVSALEESQELQDGAIADLGEAVSDIAGEEA